MGISEYVTRKIIILHLSGKKVIVGSEASYELLGNEEIKEGWNGFVIMARDKKSGNDVALKFYLPNDPEWQLDKKNYNRFQNEIAILKKAKHPNLIKCFDDGVITVETKEVPFYVMRRAKGSMRDLLEKNQLKDLEFAHRFFKELGSALQYLHKKRCFHRDLKPENILLDKNDSPLVADLGIAHINPEFAIVPVRTSPGERLRNTGYFAPELRYGDATKVDHRADICSFGYLLQEALTGRYPLGSNAILPSTVTPQSIALDAVVMKCTEVEEQNRYQSMAECLYDLNIAFSDKTRDKEQLGAFYMAHQKIRFLARYMTLTNELLSAGTLRALYLNRYKYIPSDQEKKIIFRNLIIQGTGRRPDQRGKSPDTATSDLATSENDPGALGWYWFSTMNNEEGLELIRELIACREISVLTGVAKALGVFGSSKDIELLRKLMQEKNPNIGSEAIKALVNLGSKEDFQYILTLRNSRYSAIREAVVYALARLGSKEERQIIFQFVGDNDQNVRREVLLAIGAIIEEAPELKDRAIEVLNKIIENPTEKPQVTSVAEKLMYKLNNEPYDFTPNFEKQVKRVMDRIGFDRTKVFKFLFFTAAYYQEASIRWIIGNECDKVDEIIREHGERLPFRTLQRFDYFLYCPMWWLKDTDEYAYNLVSQFRGYGEY